MTVLSEVRPLPIRPSRSDLEVLMREQGLCVSILLNTTPAVRMLDDDRHRLQSHSRDVLRRLEMEPDQGLAHVLEARLRVAVDKAFREPTDVALALFVSESTIKVFHLSVPVEDRVVIDPTFATRDVVVAVQHNPPFLLLHMDSRSANLYRYNQKYLEPVLSGDFPALREGRVRTRDNERTRAFLRTVDVGLGRHLASQDLPVVLVGGERTLAEFARITRNGAKVSGMARGIQSRPSLADLESIGRSVMTDHVEDLGAAAQDTLYARLRAKRAVTGLLGCWHAASTSHPELLVVERHFAMPARMVAEGRYVEPSDDGEHPEVIDDAVDDLIEMVLRAGGYVCVVPDGSMREHGRVAMTLAR